MEYRTANVAAATANASACFVVLPGSWAGAVILSRTAAAAESVAKPAAKLDLAQSVALAAIVNSPGNLDPAQGDKQAADLLSMKRTTLVEKMRKQGLERSE